MLQVCHFWVHSSFFPSDELVLTKKELDGPVRKDLKKNNVRFDPNFSIIIKLSGRKDARRVIDAPNTVWFMLSQQKSTLHWHPTTNVWQCTRVITDNVANFLNPTPQVSST